MKSTKIFCVVVLLCLLGMFFSGCVKKPAEEPPLEEETADIEGAIAEIEDIEQDLNLTELEELEQELNISW